MVILNSMAMLFKGGNNDAEKAESRKTREGYIDVAC
jgi:hypothetical protein